VTEDDLKAIFPGLQDDPQFRISSPLDPGYNCVAWAADDTTRVWEPMGSAAMTPAGTYWPPGVVALDTVEAYVAAFEAIGYESCETGDVEAGYEKVAIYASPSGEPLHAARQQEDGVWTSKIGGAEDIEHESPDRLVGLWYGEPSRYLRRLLGAA